MKKYVNHIAIQSQQEPILGKENLMKENNAGGFSFIINDVQMLDRFLILGAEGGSYYVSDKKLTVDNVKNLLNMIKKDGKYVVDRIVEISESGRAPKNDPAIFALAITTIYGSEEISKYALSKVPNVCRIGTHLFSFVDTINTLGKWNSRTKKGISNWYKQKDLDTLSYQLIKYQSRNGWAHRDVLRLAHVKPDTLEQSALFNWSVNGEIVSGVRTPEILAAFDDIHKNPTSVKNAINSIDKYGLTFEMLPTELLNNPDIWMALLPKMGMTALIRNLGKMSSIGLLSPLSDGSKHVISKLSDRNSIKKARVHPIQLLSALKVYSSGKGVKGSLTWNVNQKILDTLNDAFYSSFELIEPKGENYLIGVDCSASMFSAHVLGIPGLFAGDIAACMALATAKVEQNCFIVGFDHGVSPLEISPNMRLNDVLKVMRTFRWGATDCAQPMLYALKNKINVDKFVVYTDNETYYGKIHPSQALNNYRKQYGNSKLIVAGTSATNFSIADPTDSGMLDIVGFDSAAPQIISDF